MRTLAPRYELRRHQLADGEQTTVYVVRYPRRETRLSIEHFPVPQPLDRWCRRAGVQEAIVGGFFLRPHGPALGELWIGGRPITTEPVPDPYRTARAAVHVEEHEVHIAPRAELPSQPGGHLLQAGPLLVRDGTPLPYLDDRRDSLPAPTSSTPTSPAAVTRAPRSPPPTTT